MPSVKVKKLLIKHLFVTLGEWGNDQLEDLEQHLQVGAPRLGWEPLGWGGSPLVGVGAPWLGRDPLGWGGIPLVGVGAPRLGGIP